jgi:Cu/Ag efflux protein CusF
MIFRSDGLASIVAATMLLTAAAPSIGPACDAQQAPQVEKAQVEKVEGKVLKVDRAGGKVTLRQPDGTSREYLASQATLRDLKEGDRLEIKVRARGRSEGAVD